VVVGLRRGRGIVWDIVQNNLPDQKRQLQDLLDEGEVGAGNDGYVIGVSVLKGCGDRYRALIGNFASAPD